MTVNRHDRLNLYLLVLSGILLLIPTSLFGQQTDFDEANELAEEMHFLDAMEKYRSIEESGYRSGALFYNMGLVSLYQDSLGLAKSYLLQASTFTDTRQEAREALTVVEQRFERRSAVLPRLPWERVFGQLSEWPGATGIMFFSLILFLLAALVRSAIWLTNRQSVLLNATSWTALALSLLLFATSIYLERLEDRYATGVVITDRSTVYQAPTSDSATVSHVFEGYTMRVDRSRNERDDGWMYVRLENGMTGWIERDPVRTF
jgi:hypothetical protein